MDTNVKPATLHVIDETSPTPYLPSIAAHTHTIPRRDSATNVESNNDHVQSTRKLLVAVRVRDLKRKREIEYVCEEGQRKHQKELAMQQARKEQDEKRRQDSAVPITVQVEHCSCVKVARDRYRIGITFSQVSCREVIQTTHAPLEGMCGTPLTALYNTIRDFYDKQFADRHRRHQHPSAQHGDIIMEASMHMGQRVVPLSEDNWVHVLGLLSTGHASAKRLGIPNVSSATLVAKFTCPTVGKSVF